jgi:hypothetical protein
MKFNFSIEGVGLGPSQKGTPGDSTKRGNDAKSGAF